MHCAADRWAGFPFAALWPGRTDGFLLPLVGELLGGLMNLVVGVIVEVVVRIIRG